MEKGTHFSVESFAIIHDGMLGIDLSGSSRQVIFVAAPEVASDSDSQSVEIASQ